MSAGRAIRLGVISDTHGLLRPEASAALAGVERILHAGDIVKPEVLTGLASIAPVTAVRGNNDHGAWAEAIPPTAIIDVGGLRLFMLHDVHDLDFDPAARGFACVISGHSHRPDCRVVDGVLYFNPGSSGPRRFRLPISLGRLTIERGRVVGELITLPV